ncbi:FlgD immunoglobulin-like domain containing protein [Salinibacter sp. 10B]|uniref:FlgD immunoglobulin-like domain containing protein n=1 Tax=Salinibacter sp. 10B TaxID=1923971 RepID=UPI0021573AEF|nr:FlgD immunoglobulin-like domain containing protein [Salinibacter sp. 10B]
MLFRSFSVPIMKRLGLFAVLVGLLVPTIHAQSQDWKQQAKQLSPIGAPVSNQIQVMAAAGDSLWHGPLLSVYVEEAERFETAEVDVLERDNVVFSLAAQNDARNAQIWAGLAFDTGSGAGTNGFLVSTDGGRSFVRRSPQLDDPADTTVAYGASMLSADAVTRQAGSSPQDLALSPEGDTTWVAGGRSGLRWTVDQGQTWVRAVLPPDTSRAIEPGTRYDFRVGPRLEDGSGHLNHIVYSVLVDETGTVWAGTVAGLNRSRSGTKTAAGDRGWRRYTARDSQRSVTGNFVVALTEQPRPRGRNPVWMATWAAQQGGGRLQRFGVSVTTDGGTTFRQALVGERIFDIAARQDRVYAAGSSGLFVSDDQGKTWRSVASFPLQSDEKTLPASVTPRTVATTDAALWVGTNEGLLRLDRDAEPALVTGRPAWQLFRAEVPVNPEEPTEQVPDVSTYAYPNPFVPSRDQLVRIAYELSEPQTVEVNIYDFSMNRVRTLTAQKPAGQQETVWDGTDAQGLRVPTGTYFYTVQLDNRTVDGKILVAN